LPDTCEEFPGLVRTTRDETAGGKYPPGADGSMEQDRKDGGKACADHGPGRDAIEPHS
jgi:hypothetical protein